MKNIGILLLFISVVLSTTNEIANVDIDITTAYPGIKMDITVTSEQPLHSYAFYLPKSYEISSLVFLNKETEKELTFTTHNETEYTQFIVEFEDTPKISLTMAYIQINNYLPVPKFISQFDSQEFDYTLLLCPLTQSKTKSCQVLLHHYDKLKVISDTKHSTIKNTTAFGPFDDLPPMELIETTVHSNSLPHIKVNKMIHTVDLPTISSFVKVEDWFEDFTNEGAQLSSGFSRFDFQQNIGNSPNAIGFFEINLNTRASSIQYKDTSGNISTSSLLLNDDNLVLVALPRYPLLTGWKTEFMIGYSLPNEVVISKGKAIITLPSIKTAMAKEVIVRVYLPDSAKYLKVEGKNIENIEVKDCDAFLSFAERKEVLITMKNINIMDKVQLILYYEESINGSISTFIVFGCYVLLFFLGFFLFIKYSA
ncbi:hypothetical protein ENUP19_0223G0026 [Entamoeba nuttalli]|uniref:Dolichyl-diphosphooligosaccharide--protein glycosyltransferase subunit 1 n=2 Tax=Entamoeba nuttalli TaxID=412467 RepID=K2HHE0_ENTNP|nr:dolychil-diphosphooligosaccharide-- protein glycosyltransferase subunit, putative [Entamoeba nuttalli P19]EKE42364.1 dolychil-diphosphooligosaccharide-- protein glycosyltransferase subunit, putative [Entamoeba nuttalli P19]|eukprot:XP_008855298.1 dolychil-diphosphooligosaccharide-- protein glycosyltransferase subunit, putative [Entamoeba nuttalli P19]